MELTPKAQREHDRWSDLVAKEGYEVGQQVSAARVTTDARDYITAQWWEEATIVEIRNFDALVQFKDGTRSSSGLGLAPLQFTTGQHVTLDAAAATEVGKSELAAELWTVEHVRPSKNDAFLVSTADAREGKGHMRRLERVPFSALRPAE